MIDNAELLNTVMQMVTRTFEVTIATAAVPGIPVLRNKTHVVNADVAATISLVCKSFDGSIVITFERAVYQRIVSKMIGTPIENLNSEMLDGAAEILNLILGQTKTVLNNKGYDIQQAIPAVAQGEKLNQIQNPSYQSLLIPYQSDLGLFHIELTRAAFPH